MNYLLLLTSVLLGTGKNAVSKYAGGQFSGLRNLFKTNIVTAVIGIAVFSLTGINTAIFFNPLALLLAVFYGIFTMFSQMLFIKAVEYSSTAVCSLIYSMGFILPTLFSVLVLSEPFGLLKGVGILLILLSFVLVSNVKGGNTHKLYFAFLAMTASGIIGIIQKLIARVGVDIPTTTYLFLAFIVMLTVSIGGLCLPNHASGSQKINRRFLVTAALLGICVVFANSINTVLAGKMPGVIFFTCVNGGTIILSAIVSKLLFKEMLNNKQLCGIGIGIAAILAIVL